MSPLPAGATCVGGDGCQGHPRAGGSWGQERGSPGWVPLGCCGSLFLAGAPQSQSRWLLVAGSPQANAGRGLLRAPPCRPAAAALRGTGSRALVAEGPQALGSAGSPRAAPAPGGAASPRRASHCSVTAGSSVPVYCRVSPEPPPVVGSRGVSPANPDGRSCRVSSACGGVGGGDGGVTMPVTAVAGAALASHSAKARARRRRRRVARPKATKRQRPPQPPRRWRATARVLRVKASPCGDSRGALGGGYGGGGSYRGCGGL